nr:MAG TPA: hypothetical protein [Caudoviricetes sp.]DAX38999.1 MAG TPA: hypothetical protein [Caudoviricetes sp.]
MYAGCSLFGLIIPNSVSLCHLKNYVVWDTSRQDILKNAPTLADAFHSPTNPTQSSRWLVL